MMMWLVFGVLFGAVVGAMLGYRVGFEDGVNAITGEEVIADEQEPGQS